MKLIKTEEKEKINKEENKRISKLVDKKTSKKVFINLIIAVLVMTYFCSISVVYDNVHELGIVGVIKIATMVFLGIAIILLEIAYKKESKVLLIHTFEALFLAVHSLTIVYIVRVCNLSFKNYILVSSYIFSIYYVLKSIIINTKARKEYLNELSDISDIVKKEEPTKKEAVKKEKKAKNKKEELQKEVEKVEIEDDEVEINEKSNIEIKETENEEKEEDKDAEVKETFKEEKQAKQETPRLKNKKLADIRAKLRELQKQDEEVKENKTEEVEEKKDKEEIAENDSEKEVEKTEKKKKTTTKKSTTKKSTTKKSTTKQTSAKKDKKEENKEENKEEKEQVETAPKRKRGRPKKEVKKDD